MSAKKQLKKELNNLFMDIMASCYRKGQIYTKKIIRQHNKK